MIGKLLLPLLYPFAAAIVAHFASRTRRNWDLIRVLTLTGENEENQSYTEVPSVIQALRFSYQTTCFIYLLVWFKEVTSLWRTHPILTVLLVVIVLTFTPGGRMDHSALTTGN
jgi:hypothetical protein